MRTLKFLAFIGVLAILSAVTAGIYFFGGFYNVAGSAADSDLVTWALTYIRTASIARHANDMPPVSLNDPANVQAGAKAFSGGDASIVTAAPELTGPNSPRDYILIHPISRR